MRWVGNPETQRTRPGTERAQRRPGHQRGARGQRLLGDRASGLYEDRLFLFKVHIWCGFCFFAVASC